MNWFFQSAFGAVSGAFAAWIHHALYIRPRQLKIKASIPAPIKAAMQSALDHEVTLLEPRVASWAQQEADRVISAAANRIAPQPPNPSSGAGQGDNTQP